MSQTDRQLAATVNADWSRWTVVLLKPDCVARGLVDPVLTWVSTVVRLVDERLVEPTEEQIFAHYHDLLGARRDHFTWVDVGAELRRNYVGRQIGIALGYGDNAATRVRALLGHWNPAQASPDTIRGRFGTDSLRKAMADGRLIDNIIHSSDDPSGAAYEFAIWYGRHATHLLHRPPPPVNGEGP
jgi:nucleoside-diphosphate kinase